jgi:hypothetical protein
MAKVSMKYAIRPSTDSVVYIDDAANGLACLCVCQKCGEKLEAVQGSVRDWHFRHNVNRDCDGAPMTSLHRMAQQIILEGDSLAVSKKIGRVTYSGPIKEARIGTYFADVAVLAGAETVYFEVFVTSGCAKEKEKYYRDNRHKAVEMDLSEVDPAIPLPNLRQLVLEDKKNRRIIFWPDDRIDEPISSGTILTPAKKAGEWVILGMVAVGAFIWWRTRKGRQGRRRR